MFKYKILSIFLIGSLLVQFIFFGAVSASPITKTKVNPATNVSRKPYRFEVKPLKEATGSANKFLKINPRFTPAPSIQKVTNING